MFPIPQNLQNLHYSPFRVLPSHSVVARGDFLVLTNWSSPPFVFFAGFVDLLKSGTAELPALNFQSPGDGWI